MMKMRSPAGFRGRLAGILALGALPLAFGLLFAQPSELDAQAPPADRLQVLFLGDDGHHEPYERAKAILPVLAGNGIDMFYTADPVDLNAENLSRYHALMFYNNQSQISNAQVGALYDFVESGGGLVVLHSASAAFQNSEEYIRLVGGAFKAHGAGTFSTERVEPGHPALQGVPVIESWDETYVHTKHNPVGRTVLEVRREGSHAEPWTWVRDQGDGRVFYSAWGHDERTWTNEAFQRLLVQGTRWVAGDWALQRIMAETPAPTSSLPAPLPVYERPPAPWNTLAEEHIYEAQIALDVEESLARTVVPPGFSIDWFAMEPMIGRIIDFTWDEQGRMWAAETNDYPNRLLPDDEPGNDRILILEDTNGDGQADDVTVWAEGLNIVTSIAHADGGLIVAQAPHIFFMQDTDGDDRADVKETIMTGWPRNDTHGQTSNFRYGLDNQILGSVGYNGFRGTVAGRTYAPGEFRAGYFRFPADGSDLEYLARTSNNTWGVAQSEDGYIFGSTANSRPSQFVHIPARYYHALGMGEPVLPGIHDRNDIYPIYEGIRQVDQFGRYTAGAAHEIYTARSFPEAYWNRAAFVTDPTGHLVGMFDIRRDGSSFEAENRWSFMASRDTWMAPVQVKVGPDGALWVADFYSLVAQHNPTPRDIDGCCEHGEGNAYETPNRDADHARIYRISWDDAPAYEPLSLDGASPAELVATLRHDNMFWRLTAQRLLVERGGSDVVPALIELLEHQSVDAQGLNPGSLHALWTLHGLGAIPGDAEATAATRAALVHPAAPVRRAALQVLPRDAQLEDDIFEAGMLPDRSAPGDVSYTVPSSILQDSDPGVRLEALLVLSELDATDRTAHAVAQVLAVQQNLRDRWLPDAAAMAGSVHGTAFLTEVVSGDMPGNEEALEGLARAAHLMARSHANRGDAAGLVAAIAAAVDSDAVVAAEVLSGVAQGWPEGETPELSPGQIEELTDVASRVDEELEEAFALVAELWGLPEGL
ncbi:MAG: PVC-type heme-binding CxxCH protein [Gemmatimonadota bacterium]